nr:MAG TPA: Repressor protein CI [Inoviridae sp.]
MYKEMFAKKLQKARKENELTQKDVQEITGILQGTISKYEKGTLEPNIENLGILIDLYDISADWLIGTGIKNKG